MLRTLQPNEPELLRLCRCKTWTLVQDRLLSFPNEAKAVRGDGTTALSVAIRGGAPFLVIEALVHTNPSQLSAMHKTRGTVLHEAVRHACPLKTVRFLLETMVVGRHNNNKTRSSSSLSRALLGRQDDMGRTVLHYVVLRALQNGDCSGSSWNVVKRLVTSYPAAVKTMDCDGNTPLLLLLLHHSASPRLLAEAHVYRIVQLMVATCPSAATMPRKAPSTLSMMAPTTISSSSSSSSSSSHSSPTCMSQWNSLLPREYLDEPEMGTTTTNNGVVVALGDGSPTPLTYALLYGRGEETIGLLLDVASKVGPDPCLTLSSGYHEVPLHVAVTLRSSLSLLTKLVHRNPAALRIRDVHKLSPLDWVWIRHVADWCSSNPLNPVQPSTRRYLSCHNFVAWHQLATNQQQLDEQEGLFGRVLLETLWQRMTLMVVAAAVDGCRDPVYKRGEPWSMVHAASCVSCPLAMVRMALRKEGFAQTRVRDLRARRLPIHYAAARPHYRATVPVGVLSQDTQLIDEESPVVDLLRHFPQGARVVDGRYQLPLHIAIDASKQTTTTSTSSSLATLKHNNHHQFYERVIDKLVRAYPEALERRDGISLLYPYLQAAAGPGASVNTIYCLLRESPSLLKRI